MANAKEKMMEIVQQQPDDTSYEDILRELVFAKVVHKELRDSRRDEVQPSDVDYDKVDDCTLALLYLVTSEDKYGARAWKSFDWDTMNRLHEKGYICDPKSKAKSVSLREEGLLRSRELFEQLFGRRGGGSGADQVAWSKDQKRLA
jgi:hypothetical protein